MEPETRNKAVQQAVGPGYEVNFADRTIMVTDNGKRIAYLLGGKFQGFKTFVHVMLAVDPALPSSAWRFLNMRKIRVLGRKSNRITSKISLRASPSRP